MRGGGIGASLGAFSFWSSIAPCCAAPIKAPLSLNSAVPAARANAAAGKAKTKKTKAIFVAVFAIGKLHLNSLERSKLIELI